MAQGTYARRGGLDVQPAPWRCEGVEAYVFYLEADMAKLQALCDRSLNDPSGGALKYKPVVPFVVLTFQKLDDLQSLDPTHSGRFAYNEAAFWVMVSQGANTGIQLLIPYIFADNWMCVAAGREVYGYPKEVAEVIVPTETQGPESFAVRGLAVAAPNGAGDPRMEIVRCDAANWSLHSLIGFLTSDNIWTGLTRATLGTSAVAGVKDFVDLLFGDSLDFVFLRQVCAVGGGARCDLQQVIRASADPFTVEGLWPLPNAYEVTLASASSHPIASDLGLSVDANGKVPVVAALNFDLSFTLKEGKVLWP